MSPWPAHSSAAAGALRVLLILLLALLTLGLLNFWSADVAHAATTVNVTATADSNARA